MSAPSPPGHAPALPKRQLVWFLSLRILIISLFLGGAILYQLRGGAEVAHPALRYLYLLLALSYGQTLVSIFALPKVSHSRLFTHIQIVWDLIFVIFLIYITGAIESLFSFLFILIIIGASAFFSRKELLLVASAAAILYGSLIDLQYYGLLPSLNYLVFPDDVAVRDVFFTVFVNVLAFFLTALFSGALTEKLRRSEQAFAKKAIDYEELERLNRNILANLSSGLMIVNSEGLIRSFNKGASRITGLSLEEVYDREVRALFPGFAVYGDGFQEVKRGESVFVDKQGRQRILGYASSTVPGAEKNTVGLLVTFQDLTHVKDLEEQLQRADRLAAIGRLASGIAHEVRNPLASISGSVQLLLESGDMSQEDRRLMGIIVKEAERLNVLITDFLAFARPSPPQKAKVNVSRLLDELCDLAMGDRRFSGLDIRRDYPPAVPMVLDRQQVHQALWNLIINAAEAMGADGRLRLGADPETASIFVEDSGPGVPESLRLKIFDPFFTTKDEGTGLGLASVFAITEAHGGRIEVTSGRMGGACFTVFLPTDERELKSIFLENAGARGQI